ncbi:MAG: chemotaxis protein, partial [Planctomycetes bacterium]|nr:chemotaxis protein [Planctomycetota bacterium]
MFTHMKLGTKIATGFGLLILIACLLGGLAVFNMKSVQGRSTMLATEYVPEVEVANNVERNSRLTMYSVRGYGLSFDEKYLTDGRKYLAEVKKHLENAGKLAETSAHLTVLKSTVA